MCLRNGDTTSFYLIFQSLVSASLPRCWVSNQLNVGIWKDSSVLHPALHSLGQEGFLLILNSPSHNKVVGSKLGGFRTVWEKTLSSAGIGSLNAWEQASFSGKWFPHEFPHTS